MPAKIEPIEAAIDAQRGGETSRPSHQVAPALDTSIQPHDRGAFERLERPDQPTGSNPSYLA